MARTQTTRTPPTPSPNPLPLFPLPPNTQPILRPGPSAVAYHIPDTPPTPSHPIPKTTISLPRHSHWTSGLHFHTAHTEYLHLLRGAIWLHLDGSDMMLSAAAGGEMYIGTGQRKPSGAGLVIEVPKYARHEWRRAENYYGVRRTIGVRYVKPADVDDEVVVEEWTNPADLGKPLFFWNLNGVIAGVVDDEVLSGAQRVVKKVLRSWWVELQLFVIFWELDNWPVFVGLGGVLGGQSRLQKFAYRYVERSVEYFMTFVVLFAAKVLGWLIGIRAVEQRRTPGELWRAYNR
ncbi:hypothetical protein HBH56_030000 [Parastagonospora nodorum]|uniref:Uncharacterized protein n=1 Tax=Phaeosphaeria nodorum (strain SN15 / ATCC MYA-4574 / FGSC 10173) TaxID=321614 RepID=A0A7U2FA59_PHANO|nr:hypothetical protein HBH56_030000 [Parastagonospora nodorum]QRC99244.1 hypothetical protein JI435_065740 [Parastagonospora nodorum SN15]KAH3934333.1 hypothetical protein HBH54_052010 [Parastagonospora nodorum]KAH4141771.1 hypothetical protein HBH45_064770 [Parastagonospora nodorum]KAH4151069.1 hypothetical protein HBH44_173070 [Parastagonospora nodorum]